MSTAAEGHLGIAVVDDDDTFCEYACALISSQSSYVPYRAASRDELFGILNTQHIDCILLDYDLGAETGLSLKKTMDYFFREAPPIVMITGNLHASTAMEALSLGISEYIRKIEMNAAALISAISKAITETQRTQNVESILLTEAVDPLTGLLIQELFFTPYSAKFAE
jgi:DNA-binding NtrC family response regulator